MHETLERIVNNPWLNLVAGLALLGTSSWEIIEIDEVENEKNEPAAE